MNYLEAVKNLASAATLVSSKKPAPVLDPMLTVVQLSLLSFEPAQTKISIGPHDLQFEQPGITQGVIRWWHGENHEELSIIGEALKKAVVQYTGAKEKKKNASNGPDEGALVSELFKQAVLGLQHLQKTYPNSNTSDALTNWINYLQGAAVPSPAPTITPLAEKVKQTWNLPHFQNLVSYFKSAQEDFENKETSMDAQKRLQFTLQKIKLLVDLKKTEFEEILALEKSI